MLAEIEIATDGSLQAANAVRRKIACPRLNPRCRSFQGQLDRVQIAPQQRLDPPAARDIVASRPCRERLPRCSTMCRLEIAAEVVLVHATFYAQCRVTVTRADV